MLLGTSWEKIGILGDSIGQQFKTQSSRCDPGPTSRLSSRRVKYQGDSSATWLPACKKNEVASGFFRYASRSSDVPAEQEF